MTESRDFLYVRVIASVTGLMFGTGNQTGRLDVNRPFFLHIVSESRNLRHIKLCVTACTVTGLASGKNARRLGVNRPFI